MQHHLGSGIVYVKAIAPTSFILHFEQVFSVGYIVVMQWELRCFTRFVISECLFADYAALICTSKIRYGYCC